MARTRIVYRFLQAGVANYFESSGRFKYKRIPVYDASTSDLLSHSSAIVSYIATALIHGSILVHCQHGVSRSPTCVAFYLMSRQGMMLEAAMTLLKTKRPAIDPIPAFQIQLQDYERLCVESGSIVKSAAKRKHDAEGAASRKRTVVGASIGPDFQSTTATSSFDAPQKQISIGPSLQPPQNRETVAVTGLPDNRQANPPATKVTVKQPCPAQKQIPSGKRTIGPTMPPTVD
jgi:hypothetical protein